MRDPNEGCRVCGEPTAFDFCEPIAHEDIEGGREHFQAWCETHCPGHYYENEGWGPDCKYCGMRAPDDYYDWEPTYDPDLGEYV